MKECRPLCCALLLVTLCGACRRPSTVRDLTPFDVSLLPHTPVRDQGPSGADWVYAMLSLMESDALVRGDSLPLSAGFVVRRAWEEAAAAPVFRKPFSLCGTGHRLLRMVRRYGLVPEAHYPSSVPAGAFSRRMVPPHSARAASWQADSLFGGPPPLHFYLDGARYTPLEFGNMVAPEGAYEAFTSFEAWPYGRDVSLPLAGGQPCDVFRNVTLRALADTLDATLARGRTFVWEGGNSRFAAGLESGLLQLPSPCRVTARLRQASFDHGLTTGDHLLHIVGTAVSRRSDRKFYVAKGSWGRRGRLRGYVLLSEGYVLLHTVAVYRRR